MQVPHIGVLLTDGESNHGANPVQHEADLARYEGQNLIALGIGMIPVSCLKTEQHMHESPNHNLLTKVHHTKLFLVC